MNRIDLQELRIRVGYPSVTIITRCDQEELKRAFDLIMSEIPAEHAHATWQQCSDALKTLSCPFDNSVVALFLTDKTATSYVLPCDVGSVIHVGQTFRLQEVSHCLNRQQRYWVVRYNMRTPMLYEGFGSHIVPVHSTRIALVGEQIFARKRPFALCNGEGDSNCVFQTPQEVCTAIDESLSYYVEQDRLPLIVVANEEELSYLKQYSPYYHSAAAVVPSIADVWPAVQRHAIMQIEDTFAQIAEYHTTPRVVTGITNVLAAARQGLVQRVLVNAEYRVPGCTDMVTRMTCAHCVCSSAQEPIDLVDEALEAVASKGGQILLAPQSAMQHYENIVALVVENHH